MKQKKSRFVADLVKGSFGELLVQKVLQERGVRAVIANGRDYDIEASTGNRKFTIEVKYDMYAAKSGNIALEFYNPKSCRDSGVMSTKADLWMHVINDPVSVWVATVPAIKKYFVDVKPFRTISCGGDENASLFLYKKDLIFTELFARIDNLYGNDLVNLIDSLLGEKNDHPL